MNALTTKLKEVLTAVLPITAIVLILNLVLKTHDGTLVARFLTGSALIIVGLSLFLFGVDLGVTPIGNRLGSRIVKSNRLLIVVAAGLIVGFFISAAEPDLHILAEQVAFVTSGAIPKVIIVAVVSAGIAALLTLGLVRIIYGVPLRWFLAAAYLIILILSFFTSSEFLAISFDASGATTGSMTVPFILALATGIASLKKHSKSTDEDNFGLVAIASTGAILAVMVMSILSGSDKAVSGIEQNEDVSRSILAPFIKALPSVAWDSFLALLPIVVLFFVLELGQRGVMKKSARRNAFGLLYTYAGLVLFLVGVNAGFMDMGRVIGAAVAERGGVFLVAVGFLLGFVTIFAEPAVHVLTYQVENVTSGYVNRKLVKFTLAIGVSVAVALSMLRILIPELKLWQCLLPGYLISTGMMFFVPELFVGIAYDSGGVASGPMTATFILAFAQGAADAVEGANVLVDGFGVIALVAMTPLITLQVLGAIYRLRSGKKGVEKNAK